MEFGFWLMLKRGFFRFGRSIILKTGVLRRL